MITAIDSHCHIHYGPIESLAPNNLTDLMQEGEFYSAYPDVIKEISDSANIGKVLASPFDGLIDPARTEQTNEDMAQFALENDFLYQWVIIDPRNDNTFVQADRLLKTAKCVGIKLHPVCHQYALEDYADKIFSFADDRAAIVQIHPPKRADCIVPYANRYAQARFIMAHMGNMSHIDAVRQARHGNVYVDTSGRASLKNRILEYAVSQIGSERILFGTDTYSAASQRGRIEFAVISQRDKENILFHNANRLFGFEKKTV